MLLQYVGETYYLVLVNFLHLKNPYFFMLMWEKLITWTFKNFHTFLFSNLNTPIILLGKEKVHVYYVDLPFRSKWKLTIHIFIVDHRSTSLPESGPTEYSTPERCWWFFWLSFFMSLFFIIINMYFDISGWMKRVQLHIHWTNDFHCIFSN